MPRMKGFALLGRATLKQLNNYQMYYKRYVEFNFKPILEVHKYLGKLMEAKIVDIGEAELQAAMELENKLVPEEIQTWARKRKVIAFWEFDLNHLKDVAQLWVQYKQIKLEERARGEWTPESKYPEYNNDWCT